MSDETSPTPPTPNPEATPASAQAASAETAKPEADLSPPPALIAESKEGDTPKEPAKESLAPPTPFDATKLKFPEGVTADEASLTKFSEVATELGLDEAKAQKLLDLHSDVIKQAAAAPYIEWNNTQKAWQDEIKADKEFGGDKLEANLTMVSKVLDQFGDPEVRKALAYTGAGNNPAIIRTMVKMARALTEGGVVPASGVTSIPPKGHPNTLYPDLPADRRTG